MDDKDIVKIVAQTQTVDNKTIITLEFSEMACAKMYFEHLRSVAGFQNETSQYSAGLYDQSKVQIHESTGKVPKKTGDGPNGVTIWNFSTNEAETANRETWESAKLWVWKEVEKHLELKRDWSLEDLTALGMTFEKGKQSHKTKVPRTSHRALSPRRGATAPRRVPTAPQLTPTSEDVGQESPGMIPFSFWGRKRS
ncbi:hypothetical protein V494_04841 [Pseudogymnoascus sp. VKM F-4513 (FW-928)]|nr:hypothetical protein V494_04841 [Pseudogymnoascus sp. VKM F-4513 (FW-928)]